MEEIQKLEAELKKLSSKVTELEEGSRTLIESRKLVTSDALDLKINEITDEIKLLKAPLEEDNKAREEENKARAERAKLETKIINEKNWLLGKILLWNILKIFALILTIFLSVAAFYVLKLDNKNFQGSTPNNINSSSPTPNNINSPSPNIIANQIPNSNANQSLNSNSNSPQTSTPNINTPQTATANNDNSQAQALKIDYAAGFSLLAVLFAILHLSLILGYKKNAEDAYDKIIKLKKLEAESSNSAKTTADIRKEYEEIISSR